jgi:chromosome partitioning protein
VTRVIATYNIKGGVGKTSAAVNLAHLAARDGARALLWDLDPQAASTYLFRIKPKVRGGARKLVGLRSEVARLIKGTDYQGLDLLPADFSYRHLDLALDGFKRPTRRLAQVLAPLRADFEAADALLVPIIPATLSSRTFDQLESLDTGRAQVLGFFSMVDVDKPLHREVMASVRAAHPASMLGAAIPASEEVEWMGAERDAVAAFAPGSVAAMAYEALWWDVRRRLAGRQLSHPLPGSTRHAENRPGPIP